MGRGSGSGRAKVPIVVSTKVWPSFRGGATRPARTEI
jgi:hypothetical protein